MNNLKLFLMKIYYNMATYIRYYTRSLYTKKHNIKDKVIVSLTSYPKRYNTLHLTIMNLLSQKIQSNFIILWIYEKDIESLPKKIIKMQCDSFQIRSLSTNIRSYGKLIPSLKKYPKDIIVTADDDLYYPCNWLSQLLMNYEPTQKEVIGLRAHRIILGDDKVPISYNNWEWSTQINTSGEMIFLTSGHGILFPPGSLYEEVCDDEIFMKKCPTTDDIWYYFMIRKNNYKCRRVGKKYPKYTWNGTQETALGNDNVGASINDVSMRNLIQKYGF